MKAVLTVLAISVISIFAREEPTMSMTELKSMSLEQLLDIEVTSVSKRPEKLVEAASAIQVITREDIRRSGATCLPEALRLASNLQVARLDSREWAISARGFNNTFANKLLVMIDGRTVYTPLYSGVFWDAQHVLLEDVDRIEVVSGPGGTLWGSNAVNGVINIVTRDAAATQGLYASAGGGDLLRDFAEARSGGYLGNGVSYRVYGRHADRLGLNKPDGKEVKNPSWLSQGGFRMDWQGSPADHVTVQGDIYATEFGPPGAGAGTKLNGQNILGSVRHEFSAESGLRAQFYFDRTWRKANFTPQVFFEDELKTYDFDFQHRFPLGAWQHVMWGAGYRLMQDDVENLPFLFYFSPADKTFSRFNAFAQDELEFLSRRLKITLGTKIEHEEFSGFNVQPSARAAWSHNERHTVWGAVSRAERTPSRIDVEFFTPVPPTGPKVYWAGGPDFESESLLAYELGYRVQPIRRLSLSLAAFYHQYDRLRSLEYVDFPADIALVFRNGLEGDSRGIEISGNLQAASWWRLRGGYTYLESGLWSREGHTPLEVPPGKWNDPSQHCNGQSMMDLPFGFALNLSGYYVTSLRTPHVQPRLNYDAGLVWSHRGVEASLHGRNLADDQDPEFRNEQPQEEVPRSFLAAITLRF